jgi:hypothetical protein
VNNKEILNKSPEAQNFAKYEGKTFHITKDGHTMLYEDIVKDLNRKSFLESELIEFKNRIAELEKDLFTQSQESKDAVKRAIEIILEKNERIAELEKTEPLLQKVLDCCDGLHCEYTQANYGDAKNWLRHISDAYADYQDSIDLTKGGAN